MSEGRRGGERRRLTQFRRRRRTQARDTVACGSGRVLRSVLRPVLVNPHYAPSGKTAVVGRSWRYRGWVNSRKRDEPAPGSSRWTQRGSPRITARKSGVVRKKRKVVEATVPARKRGPRFGCPHVDKAVAEVTRRRLISNKLGYALQKERQGRVNGGLARSERRWMKPSTGTASERYAGVPASIPNDWVRSGRRLRVARECHLAVGPSPKAVSRSRDRGCSGHRIL